MENNMGRLDCAQNFGETLDLPDNTLDALLNKTAFYWRNQGSEESELYYSVITQDEFRKNMINEEKSNFFESGAFFIERVKNHYEKYTGKQAVEADCLDFGCGVGRLAVNAMKYFRSIYGVDFSQSHLEDAIKNIKVFAPEGDFRPILISKITDADHFPAVDVCYSFISLQHNTPPVIKRLISRLLESLKPGGMASLHIPIAIPDYSFETE
ncbi:MAG: hypothetical protein CSA50_02125 [Gammaproteobacteria bacterium]|nr:MAG: hypothetical protein CSA50_02125 [Gammaproteobacteria bacterium]